MMCSCASMAQRNEAKGVREDIHLHERLNNARWKKLSGMTEGTKGTGTETTTMSHEDKGVSEAAKREQARTTEQLRPAFHVPSSPPPRAVVLHVSSSAPPHCPSPRHTLLCCLPCPHPPTTSCPSLPYYPCPEFRSGLPLLCPSRRYVFDLRFLPCAHLSPPLSPPPPCSNFLCFVLLLLDCSFRSHPGFRAKIQAVDCDVAAVPDDLPHMFVLSLWERSGAVITKIDGWNFRWAYGYITSVHTLCSKKK